MTPAKRLRSYLLQLLREDLVSIEVNDVRGIFVDLNPVRFTDDYQNFFEFSELQKAVHQQAASFPDFSCFQVEIQYGLLIYKKIPNVADWWFWDLQVDPNAIRLIPIQQHPMDLRSVYEDPEVKQALDDRMTRDRNRMGLGPRLSYPGTIHKSNYATPSKAAQMMETHPVQAPSHHATPFSASRPTNDVLSPQNLGNRATAPSYTISASPIAPGPSVTHPAMLRTPQQGTSVHFASPIVQPGGMFYGSPRQQVPQINEMGRSASKAPNQGLESTSLGSAFYPPTARGNLMVPGMMETRDQTATNAYNFPVAARRKGERPSYSSYQESVREPIREELDEVIEEVREEQREMRTIERGELRINNAEICEAVKRGWITWDDLIFSQKIVNYVKENWDKLVESSF